MKVINSEMIIFKSMISWYNYCDENFICIIEKIIYIYIREKIQKYAFYRWTMWLVKYRNSQINEIVESDGE